MKVCFLGHQTWLISEKNTFILIDPILKDQFGASLNAGFQIYPPRNINISKIPKLSGIIISHEHSDHFDIESLNLLSRDIPVYLGVLVISPVVETIEELGFKVYKIPSLDSSTIEFEDISLTLFPSGRETAFWEKKVNQIYIQSKHSLNDSLFIAVDALISDQFCAKVNSQEINYPKTIIVSNNSQITPIGVFGALENRKMIQTNNPFKTGLVGLKVLHTILFKYFESASLPIPDNIIICGSGFMKDSDNFGPFPFSDQDELAVIASSLSIEKCIKGLLPGESVDLERPNIIEKVDWITLDSQRMKMLQTQRENFIKEGRVLIKSSLLPDYKTEEEKKNKLNFVLAELNSMIPAMMFWDLGKRILSLTEYQSKPLGRKRFVICLLDGPEKVYVQIALDFIELKFNFDDTPQDKLVEYFPFGLELYYRDFIGVATGEIQIWDIAGIALESWYEGPDFEGPVPFLYSYYGENTSPHLAKLAYTRSLDNLEKVK